MNGGAEEELDSPLILRYIALIHAQITEMLLDHHVRGEFKNYVHLILDFFDPYL